MNCVFHVTDKCNLRCFNCHWFSMPVKECKELSSKIYLNFLKKWDINNVRISGGEPTLYYDFLSLINNIPEKISLMVNMNGTNIEILRRINRKVKLAVSINRTLPENFVENIKSLGQEIIFVSFLPTLFPELNTLLVKNQLSYQADELIGKKGICYYREIRFGSDGWAYFCEKGLRSKNSALRCSFSLFSGKPEMTGKECYVSKECASGLDSENIFYKK